MNSSITMSAQSAVIKSPNNERIELKNRKVQQQQQQNAWSYISNRILNIIHKTFRKGELNIFSANHSIFLYQYLILSNIISHHSFRTL
jgi:hypothetical protein